MKTQKFLLEVTDPTGQFPVSESLIKQTLDEHLPQAYRFNVMEQHERTYTKIEGEKETNKDTATASTMKPTVIHAEMHSDNHVHEVEFDAEEYFKEADDKDLHDLVDINFRGDYASDKVAEFFEESIPEIKGCLEYCRDSNIGFECIVNEEDAVVWLKQNRPNILTEPHN